MNKAKLLESLSQQANTESENLCIQMGNRVVYGQTAKEFRDELDNPKAEIIFEATTRASDFLENSPNEQPDVSGVIEIRNNDSQGELLFRQDGDGSVVHNQVQPSLVSLLEIKGLKGLAATSQQVNDGEISLGEAISSTLTKGSESSSVLAEEEKASLGRSFFDNLKKQIEQVSDIGGTKKWLSRFVEKATQKVADTAKEVKQEVEELEPLENKSVGKEDGLAKSAIANDERETNEKTKQQEFVDRTAPIVALWINTVDPDGYKAEGSFHSARWDEKDSLLTLDKSEPEEAKRTIMYAKWDGKTWVDKGSNLTEDDAKYFEGEVQSKLQQFQVQVEKPEKRTSFISR